MGYRQYDMVSPYNDDSVITILFLCCETDFNSDKIVDLYDAVLFSKFYGTNYAGADFDKNGLVDLFDAIRFANMFGTTTI